MKRFKVLIFSLAILTISSCNKDENDNKTGFVTFGANYHVINCTTTVAIYVDGNNIGTLENPTNEILDCEQNENLTKEVSFGEHSYKVEIRPNSGTGCTKDISGTFDMIENECEKIFVDFYTIEF